MFRENDIMTFEYCDTRFFRKPVICLYSAHERFATDLFCGFFSHQFLKRKLNCVNFFCLIFFEIIIFFMSKRSKNKMNNDAMFFKCIRSLTQTKKKISRQEYSNDNYLNFDDKSKKKKDSKKQSNMK